MRRGLIKAEGLAVGWEDSVAEVDQDWVKAAVGVGRDPEQGAMAAGLDPG